MNDLTRCVPHKPKLFSTVGSLRVSGKENQSIRLTARHDFLKHELCCKRRFNELAFQMGGVSGSDFFRVLRLFGSVVSGHPGKIEE